jgi:fucose permease
MFDQLPNGLDVYSILMAALSHPEYRDKLLFLVGTIWGFGFIVGVAFCAIFVNPSLESKAREYDRQRKR